MWRYDPPGQQAKTLCHMPKSKLARGAARETTGESRGRGDGGDVRSGGQGEDGKEGGDGGDGGDATRANGKRRGARRKRARTTADGNGRRWLIWSRATSAMTIKFQNGLHRSMDAHTVRRKANDVATRALHITSSAVKGEKPRSPLGDGGVEFAERQAEGAREVFQKRGQGRTKWCDQSSSASEFEGEEQGGGICFTKAHKTNSNQRKTRRAGLGHIGKVSSNAWVQLHRAVTLRERPEGG